MKALKRKLFLSIASLAVCAATLVSTTFAWYTSNTEVSASNVTGTSQANSAGLLLISKTGAEGTFTNSVDLNINTSQLQPVQYTPKESAAPTLNTWNPGSNVADGAASPAGNDGAAAATGAYIKIDLWFRGVAGGDSPTGVPVYLKNLTLTNSTVGALPAKDILSNGGGLTASQSQTTYTVDILRTIMIGYTVETGAPNQVDNPSAYAYTFGSQGMLDPEGLCQIKTDSLSSLGDKYDAHAYYEAVTGNSLGDATEKDPILAEDSAANEVNVLAAGTQIKLGTTPNSTAAYNALKVTFYVFINGWDKACFDAIQGQTFTLSLGFSSNEGGVNSPQA